MTVRRVFVEKKPPFDVEARQLACELRDFVGLGALEGVRIINRYDVEGADEELFERCIPIVFAEPQTSIASRTQPPTGGGTAETHVIAIEYLPGQFDQRADSAAECMQLVSQGERPTVKSATLYYLTGKLDGTDLDAARKHLVNPIEAREAALEMPETLEEDYPPPPDVEVLGGFTKLDDAGLEEVIKERGLAMNTDDIKLFQAYFRDTEVREPTITELRVVDTYWSDHCRHTTFNTTLTDVSIDDVAVREAYERYLAVREELGRGDRPVTLMDMATIGARYLKYTGEMTGVDESDEVNACTVRVDVDVDGRDEEWLYLFKNETHNHPTEVEPFGGAATCVGGCIRDPLSGRAYVHQAMRLTGAADPTAAVSETMPGKLPQRKIVTDAAEGYSSYGNQIGLATGQVRELYHPGYAAKRMEIGAVVGAAPASHVRREVPAPGDVIVLLGGRTGRDGIGGATGSSKAHDAGSIEHCGAEVQKGNAPVERKLQRLFRRGEATRLIKRCNDFGAGGVSVACGELADGLAIELDGVLRKYDGLDGTELAISESQERMACVVAAGDAEEFCRYAREENLEATVIAKVTEEKRVTMRWRGQTIVSLAREFLDANGAAREAVVHVGEPGRLPVSDAGDAGEAGLGARLRDVVCSLTGASQKGLAERFDSTIGAATVLMPFGGTRQLTPALAMVAKLPVEGETQSVSGMAWGFDPYLSEADPYRGAYLAVTMSISKLVASGFRRRDTYLTFQEYFGSLRDVPERWGLPMSSLLGALSAQLDLRAGAIGGKDSMSGSFEDLDVPPTLVSFATACGDISRVTSPEFKGVGHDVVLVSPARRDDGLLPEAESMRSVLDAIEHAIGAGAALAVSVPGQGGLAGALFEMCVGNRVGVALEDDFDTERLFGREGGDFIVEVADGAVLPEVAGSDGADGGAGSDGADGGGASVRRIGVTTERYELACGGEQVALDEIEDGWLGALEGVFAFRDTGEVEVAPEAISSRGHTPVAPAVKVARPQVVIPVFPGTNCEYDSARAFERAGAEPDVFVVNNLTPAAIAESATELARRISEAQILMLPGGFSGGDEPDGAAKLIVAFFRNPRVTQAVHTLLDDHGGLALGICNGFQALVKLGLVPYGEIRDTDEDCPTLAFNTIGRHQSRLVRTRVASDLSPWLAKCEIGDIHMMPVSHGEGRFTASEGLLAELASRGQIAAQYVDADGRPSMSLEANPNGSVLAIEAVTSPDGRVLGKMGHTERSGSGLYQNVPGVVEQPLFEGGVAYFA